MMLPQLVSVALCTYNGGKHLSAQIESILSQGYENIELIIVDDNSSDDTYSIVKHFANKDARIQCHQNTSNLGFNKNFEKAVSLTKGDFIAISDQDDIWEPQKLQVLIDRIADNWLVFSNSVLMTEAGSITQDVLLNNFELAGRDYKSLLLFNYVTGHTCLIARQLLNYAMPFPDTGYYDWWMGFVAFYHNKLTYANQLLTRYRIHDQSVIQNVLNNDDLTFKILDFKSSLTMLSHFSAYSHLNEKDQHFIKKVKAACEQKLKRSYHLPLINIVYNNYHSIFFNGKKRKGISKLGFAIRYSRKLG